MEKTSGFAAGIKNMTKNPGLSLLKNRKVPMSRQGMAKRVKHNFTKTKEAGKERLYSEMNKPRAAMNRFANRYIDNHGLTL